MTTTKSQSKPTASNQPAISALGAVPDSPLSLRLASGWQMEKTLAGRDRELSPNRQLMQKDQRYINYWRSCECGNPDELMALFREYDVFWDAQPVVNA